MTWGENPPPPPIPEEKKKKKRAGGVRFGNDEAVVVKPSTPEFGNGESNNGNGDAIPGAAPSPAPSNHSVRNSPTPSLPESFEADRGVIFSAEPPFPNMKNRTVYTLRIALRCEGLSGSDAKKRGTYCYVKLETDDVSHRVRQPEKRTKVVKGSNPVYCDDHHAICFEVTDSDVSTVADALVRISVHAVPREEESKPLFSCFASPPFSTRRAVIRTQDVIMSARRATEEWISLEGGGKLHVAAELTGPERGHLHFAMMPHERSVVVDHEDDEVFTVVSKFNSHAHSGDTGLVVTVKDMEGHMRAVMEQVDDTRFRMKDGVGSVLGDLVVEGLDDGTDGASSTGSPRDLVRRGLERMSSGISSAIGGDGGGNAVVKTTPRGSHAPVGRGSSSASLPAVLHSPATPGMPELSRVNVTLTMSLRGRQVGLRPLSMEGSEAFGRPASRGKARGGAKGSETLAKAERRLSEDDLNAELNGLKVNKAGSFELFTTEAGAGRDDSGDEDFVASCLMELRSLRKATSFTDGFRGMVVELAREHMQSAPILLALAQTVRHIEQGSSRFVPEKYLQENGAARNLFYTGMNKNMSANLEGGGGANGVGAGAGGERQMWPLEANGSHMDSIAEGVQEGVSSPVGPGPAGSGLPGGSTGGGSAGGADGSLRSPSVDSEALDEAVIKPLQLRPKEEAKPAWS